MPKLGTRRQLWILSCWWSILDLVLMIFGVQVSSSDWHGRSTNIRRWGYWKKLMEIMSKSFSWPKIDPRRVTKRCVNYAQKRCGMTRNWSLLARHPKCIVHLFCPSFANFRAGWYCPPFGILAELPSAAEQPLYSITEAFLLEIDDLAQKQADTAHIPCRCMLLYVTRALIDRCQENRDEEIISGPRPRKGE
jgi:hypothetical protein